MNADGSIAKDEINGFDTVHLWVGSSDGCAAYVFSRWDGLHRLTYGLCCAPGTVPRFLSHVGIETDSTPTEYKNIETIEEGVQNTFPSGEVQRWLDKNGVSHEFADLFFAHPECLVQTGCKNAYDDIWSGLHLIRQRKAAALTV